MQEGKQLLAAINAARANPQGCIEDIKEQLSRFQSNNVMRTNKGIKIRVNEGKSSWQDAILYLQRAKPKEPIKWSESLADAAQLYNCQRNPHEEPNPFKLLKAKYSYEGSVSFNINESDIEQTARELVISMIVGDGDEKKGNRTTIFNTAYKTFGAVVARTTDTIFVPMYFADTDSFKAKPFNENQLQGGYSQASFFGNKSKYLERGREMIAQLNKIRKDPKYLIPLIKKDVDRFKDDKTLVKDNVTIKTKEGRSGYYDLLSELEEAYPIPLLKQSQGLSIAGLEQVLQMQKIQKNNQQEQVKPTNFQLMVKKYCVVSETIGNIIMNRTEDDTYDNMLILLLVGDGDKKRSARRKLLSPVLKVVGIAVGENYFVINIGESAKDNKEEVEKYLQFSSNNKPAAHSNNKALSPPKNALSFLSQNSDSIAQGERVVKKKTTKTSTFMRGGKHYKRTQVVIAYADGEIQQIDDEELID